MFNICFDIMLTYIRFLNNLLMQSLEYLLT